MEYNNGMHCNLILTLSIQPIEPKNMMHGNRLKISSKSTTKCSWQQNWLSSEPLITSTWFKVYRGDLWYLTSRLTSHYFLLKSLEKSEARPPTIGVCISLNSLQLLFHISNTANTYCGLMWTNNFDKVPCLRILTCMAPSLCAEAAGPQQYYAVTPSALLKADTLM